ncbi:MAG: hypothetical protein AUJ12_08130 [Alphaproteobacteria bacterium CG1_02_46_17]|nr:MAG: hypothetical protein AUJ12_08130 [Alphaproteobacteria bacterium CG1_02_46_17]
MELLEKTLTEFMKTRDIEKFLASGISLKPEKIQSYILSLPEDRQKDVRAQLTEVMNALSSYIEKLDIEKAEIKEQIDQNLKSVQACLSYGSAQGLTKNKKK